MNRKTSTLLSLGLSVALIAAGIWIIYHYPIGMWRTSHHWHLPYHMTAGAGMGIVAALFWLAVLAAVVLMVLGAVSERRASKQGRVESKSDAVRLLKRRYASGEIGRIEYHTLRRQLQ